MDHTLSNIIEAFQKIPQKNFLIEGLHGLEKESLRIDEKGKLAMTPHPASLGNSLTDPHITTDFAESQLEFITSPFSTPEEAIAELERLHRFAVEKLREQHELIWPLSMPARLPDDPEEIPIARFGDSPEGQKKEIYRFGLAFRYGSYMQTICGIHYNLSFAEDFWKKLRDLLEPKADLQNFINEKSLHLVRNFIRYRWLLVLLFGASPNHDATYRCRSLNSDRDNAVSLRLSRCGYSNPAKIPVTYNRFEQHLSDLKKAVATPYAPYTALGLERNGQRIQLNDHLLQIGNEYYFPIRLKPPKPYEDVLDALTEHGVNYIEMRMFDLNPYEPTGVKAEQLYFTKLFLLYCLFEASPPIDDAGVAEGGDNQQCVALKGRLLDLELKRDGKPISIRAWGEEIFQKLQPIAELLDQAGSNHHYQTILSSYYHGFQNPQCLPSFQMLKDMNKSAQSFLEFGLERAQKNAE